MCVCVWGGGGGGNVWGVCIICVCVYVCGELVCMCSMCVCAIKAVWMYAILRSTIAHPGISILTFRSQ